MIFKSYLIEQNFENLRYEGYGAFNVALIIETLTDNKNRSASKIRTLLQKNGGRLGENGSTSHLFYNCGVIHFDKNSMEDNDVIELSLLLGANDCKNYDDYHEIITDMKDFYKVKSKIETKVKNILYSGIEWRPKTVINLSESQKKTVREMIENLDEIDDVQKIFTNCNFYNN